MFLVQLVLYQFIFRHRLKPFLGHYLTLRFFNTSWRRFLDILEVGHKLEMDFLLLPPNPIYSLLECIAIGFFLFIKITRTLESYHFKRNSIITNKDVSWNVEVCREIEQLSDILHFSLEMTNHPISFQRGAILPNLDPQNNFPISKCYI